LARKFHLEELKTTYIDYIYRCNKSFGTFSNWWYLPSSSRERIGTFVQDDYVNLLSDKKIKRSSNKGFKNFLQKFPSLKSFLSLLRDNFLLLQILLRNKPKFKRKVDILFIHPIHDLPIRKQNGSIWNHYFGELPENYLNLGLNVEVSGVNDPGIFVKDIIFQERGYRISNSLCYLKWQDLIKANLKYFKHFLIGLKFPKPIDDKEKLLHKLIQKESKSKLYNIFWGNIYSLAFDRLIKKLNPKHLFQTYENNWWERSINIAYLRNRDTVQKCIGFIHCSVLESHMKYTLVQDEWRLKPGPNELLITGKNILPVLSKRGNYEISKIRVGYDLRGPNLYSIQKRSLGKITKLLVLLEGLDTMPDLLLLILESIPMDIYQLSVRCHPVFSIEKPEFHKIRNHNLYSKLTVTRGTTLEDDLKNADLVIYKGSTSALYAAYMGIPLIRFQDEWWASDDPLHNCNYLKKEFSTSEELLEGIQYFKDMDQLVFNEQKEKLQEYVFQYMQPYKDDELKKLAQELIS
jgi:hypothetical protein